jgi:cyclopropane fatty-acyl-phospholipid synthase-like methyltransferase
MSDSIFTGEFFVPGQAPKRLEEDHLSRYAFASRFVEGKRVLDVACGSGYGTRELFDAGALSVDGVDLSREVVAFANDRFACDGVQYKCDSIYTYASDAPYDVIVSFETVEHVDDHMQALKNLYSLLADDGLLIISSPNRFVTSPKADSIKDKPANPYHVIEFEREEFVGALRSAGFVVRDEDVFGQRLQPRLQHKGLRKFYRKVFRPHIHKDPSVQPVGNKEPRYFVLTARKC